MEPFLRITNRRIIDMVFSHKIVWVTTWKVTIRECFEFDFELDHEIE